MKTTLFYLVLLMAGPLFSQSPVIYSEVIQLDSVPKSELFARTQMAFVTMFKSSKDVVQFADKENGKIVGKAIFIYSPTIFSGNQLTRGVVRYTVTIQVKEGRYKYEISDFRHSADKPTSDMSMGLLTTSTEAPEGLRPYERKWANNVWNDIKIQAKKEADKLSQMIILEMIKPSTGESTKEDW